MPPPRTSHVVFLVVAAVWLGLRVPGALTGIATEDIGANVAAVRAALEEPASDRIAQGLRLDPGLARTIDERLADGGTLLVLSPHRGEPAETELGLLRARLAVWLYPRRAVAVHDADEARPHLASDRDALLVLDLSGTGRAPFDRARKLEEIGAVGWIRLWQPREGGP